MTVKITFETLFEILRKEKTNDSLQKLEPNFLNDYTTYLNEKEKIIKQLQSKQDPFSTDEIYATQNQVKSIKKIMKEILERRQRKILEMALNKVRINAQLIDTSSLQPPEQELYNTLIKEFEKYQQKTINKILSGTNITKTTTQEQTTQQLVRFKQPVEKFLGEDLTEYGPFNQDDVATLPKNIVQLLTNQQKVEQIEQNNIFS